MIRPESGSRVTTPADDPIARNLNEARKYVASRTLNTLDWANSELLGDDVVGAIRALKGQDGFDLQVIGSAGLVQTLQGAELVDEFHVWTFPVVLGRGKRLFEVDAKPQGLRLLSSQTSPSGVVMSRYAPAGEVPVGTMETIAPSEKERARRERWAQGKA